MSFSSVIVLFLRSAPLAVIGRVVAFIIPSIKGFSVRALSHVCKEVCEGIEPSLADSDASSAVVLIPSGLGIGASGFHGSPRAISWSAFASSGSAMPRLRSCLSYPTAAATFREAVYKVSSAAGQFFAAIAKAVPDGSAIHSFAERDGGNFAELAAAQINKAVTVLRGLTYNRFSHDVSFTLWCGPVAFARHRSFAF